MTYSIQIHSHQHRMTKKPIIQRRHIAADDETHDARVIELVAPFGHGLGMVRKRVKSSAHAETQSRAGQKTSKHKLVGGARVRAQVSRADDLGT